MTSAFGALMSLLIMCFTIFYGIRKFEVMYNRQDSLQQVFVDIDSIDHGAINPTEVGFKYGAFKPPRVPKYIDPLTNETVQPTFDQVFTIQGQVSTYDDDLVKRALKQVEIGPCSDEELNEYRD